MQPFFKSFRLLAFIATLTLIRSLHADEPQRLEPLPLTAADISSVTGLNIYKFKVPIKPRTEFEIVISVLDTADAKPRVLKRNSFKPKDDVESADLLLSFLPRDNTLRGVLLSQDEEVVYRVDCKQCSPPGISTIISLPLSDVRGTQKTLIPMTPEQSQRLSGKNEICLIAILAEDGNPVSMQKTFPRAMVSVNFVE